MSKKTPCDRWHELHNKLNEIAVAVLRDGVLAGRIVGTGRTSVTKMSMQFIPPDTRETPVIYAYAEAGGYGYNKVDDCIQQMFRENETALEEAFDVRFYNPEHITMQRLAWGGYCKEILKQAGFTLIEVLGGI